MASAPRLRRDKLRHPENRGGQIASLPLSPFALALRDATRTFSQKHLLSHPREIWISVV